MVTQCARQFERAMRYFHLTASGNDMSELEGEKASRQTALAFFSRHFHMNLPHLREA